MAETPRQIPRTLWIGTGLFFGFLALACLFLLAELKQPLALPVIGRLRISR